MMNGALAPGLAAVAELSGMLPCWQEELLSVPAGCIRKRTVGALDVAHDGKKSEVFSVPPIAQALVGSRQLLLTQIPYPYPSIAV